MSWLWSELVGVVSALMRASDPVPMPDEQRASWLRQLGVWVIAARCVLLPLAFDPRATYAFGLPKASGSRALFYLLLAALVTYLIVHRGRPLRWSPIYAAVLLLVAVYVMATLTAVHMATALFGAPGRYLGLVTLLDNVLFAVAIGVFVRTRRDLVVVGAATVGAAALTLGYGLVQAVGRDPIPWESASIFSTLGNSGPFAGYLLTVGAAVGAFLLADDGRTSWMWRSALALFVALCVAAVVLRGSRASALALVPVAIALTVLAYRYRAAGLGPARRRLAAAGTLVAVMATSIVIALTPAGAGVMRLVAGGDSSVAERAVIYRAALEVVRSHPLLGVGPDNFVAVYGSAREAVPGSVAVTAETSTHSWVLKTATDAGALGLAAFLLLVATILLRAWRGAGLEGHESSVVAGALAVAFLAQGVVSVSDVSTEWLFWLAVGLVAAGPVAASAAVATAENGRGGRGRRSRRRGSVQRRTDGPYAVAAAAVGLLLATTVLSALSASQFSKLSLLALGKDDGATAVRAALEATRRDGGRGEPWNVLGASYSLGGRTEQGIVAFRRAVEAEPYRRTYLTNLAEEELKLVAAGRREYAERAIQDAKAAVDVAPSDPVSHYSYARILNILGGWEKEAADQADRAAQLWPDNLTYLKLAVTAQERAGELSRAIEWQRQVAALEASSRESRLRLARLYLMAGDNRSARALVAPPRVSSADRACTPVNGVAVSSDKKETRPLCFRVLFTSDDQLQTDPDRTDSVRRPGNFVIDGQPLPPTTVITYDPELTAVVVQIPARSVSPGPNATLTVMRIANLLGFPLEPDPTTLLLP